MRETILIMLNSTFVFLALSLIWTNVYGQGLKSKLSGQLLDHQTQTPIAFVHIVGSVEQTISDSKGMFSISTFKGDTIKFSHINFERYDIKISEIPERTIPIYLTKKETVLQEVIIRDYLLEDELKQEIIAYEVKTSKEEANAVYNVANSTVLYLQGYTPEMNSLDNFKNYIKEPKGVTLFSSDPSKGLIKSIKKLNQQNSYLDPYRLKLNKVKIDTAQILLFKLPNE